MKIENIIKRLNQNGKKVYLGQFDFQEVWMCNGTALIDLLDGKVVPTSAKYADVVKQIEEGRSHIYTVDDIKKKVLNTNLKWHG